MEDRNVSQSFEKVYVAINNIPQCYRSADLRRFFSQFVETGGFDCFHFRHRPEKQSVKTSTNSQSEVTTSTIENDFKSSTKSHSDNDMKKDTFCCIIRVSEVKYVQLTRTYHQRNWQDDGGESISSKCLISRLKTSLASSSPTLERSSAENTSSTVTSSGVAPKYQTRRENQKIPAEREEFREEDLLKLPELCPPTVMPHGNVGTPTMHFLKLIQECRLPSSIIKKLQLDFPKSKSKGKYGNVPFDYHTQVIEIACGEDDMTTGEKAQREQECEESEPVVKSTDRQHEEDCEESGSHLKSADSHDLTQGTGDTAGATSSVEPQAADQPPQSSGSTLDYREKRRLKKLAKRETRKLMAEKIEEKMIEFEKAGSDSEDDNDTCEEWERHEAMYDDVTNQGRNKDRLFEEEMEVIWDKGSSGLVFYTDAQYWQAKEGDFDEQTTDDLNVDMSIYYEDGAGDKDIRDFVTIRQEQRRRRGIEKTDRFSAGIGKFEQHTKGFGRKIMEKQGWADGAGLGSSVQGITDALDNDGQNPRDRRGFGYHAEKLVRYGTSAKRKRKANRDVIISTIYDNPDDNDPLEPLRRRNDPSHIKHRNRLN